MENMKILPVEMKDAAELLSIYAPYVEKTAVSFEYEVPSLPEFSERILKITEKYPYIKAVDEDGKILGYAYAAAFHVREAYMWCVETTIYLRPDMKRKGIGRALYDALEQKLKDMGILNMNACIAVPAEEDRYLNNDSLRFHEKMGFQMVGRFHQCGYKFETWYDMVWMEKMIGAHTKDQAPVCFEG